MSRENDLGKKSSTLNKTLILLLNVKRQYKVLLQRKRFPRPKDESIGLTGLKGKGRGKNQHILLFISLSIMSITDLGVKKTIPCRAISIVGRIKLDIFRRLDPA